MTDDGKKIQIHYKKIEGYRTYHVDGAYGGLTPKANIYVEFFVERHPTPKIVEHTVGVDGMLGEGRKVDGLNGIVRQIECGISLDLTTAIALRDFLSGQISKLQQVLSEGNKKTDG